MEDHEREGLKDFLEGLRLLLEQAVYRHPEWFPDELVGPMESAWRDVEPLFQRVSRDIDSRDYDQALEDEGLVGAQLRFKLVGFTVASRAAGVVTQRVAAAAGNPETSGDTGVGFEISASTARKRRRGLLRYFKVALDWGNAIIESIGVAIPGAGAIGEFKKGVEAANRLNDENSKPFLKRLLGL